MGKKFCEKDYDKKGVYMGYTQEPEDNGGCSDEKEDQDGEPEPLPAQEQTGEKPTMKKALSDDRKVRVAFIAYKEVKTGRSYSFQIDHEVLIKKKSEFSSNFIGPKSIVTIQDHHAITPLWLAKKWQSEAIEKEKNEALSDSDEVKDF